MALLCRPAGRQAGRKVDTGGTEPEFAQMSGAAFDTHSSVKTLTAAGMPEPQPEAVTALLKVARDADFSTLASKADLAQVKAVLRREIAEFRAELQREIAELRPSSARKSPSSGRAWRKPRPTSSNGCSG